MTFIANIDLCTAFHYLTEWRIAGHRARIVQLENGYWMAAKLESATYKAL